MNLFNLLRLIGIDIIKKKRSRFVWHFKFLRNRYFNNRNTHQTYNIFGWQATICETTLTPAELRHKTLIQRCCRRNENQWKVLDQVLDGNWHWNGYLFLNMKGNVSTVIHMMMNNMVKLFRKLLLYIYVIYTWNWSLSKTIIMSLASKNLQLLKVLNWGFLR